MKTNGETGERPGCFVRRRFASFRVLGDASGATSALVKLSGGSLDACSFFLVVSGSDGPGRAVINRWKTQTWVMDAVWASHLGGRSTRGGSPRSSNSPGESVRADGWRCQTRSGRGNAGWRGSTRGRRATRLARPRFVAATWKKQLRRWSARARAYQIADPERSDLAVRGGCSLGHGARLTRVVLDQLVRSRARDGEGAVVSPTSREGYISALSLFHRDGRGRAFLAAANRSARDDRLSPTDSLRSRLSNARFRSSHVRALAARRAVRARRRWISRTNADQPITWLLAFPEIGHPTALRPAYGPSRCQVESIWQKRRGRPDYWRLARRDFFPHRGGRSLAVGQCRGQMLRALLETRARAMARVDDDEQALATFTSRGIALFAFALVGALAMWQLAGESALNAKLHDVLVPHVRGANLASMVRQGELGTDALPSAHADPEGNDTTRSYTWLTRERTADELRAMEDERTRAAREARADSDSESATRTGTRTGTGTGGARTQPAG